MEGEGKRSDMFPKVLLTEVSYPLLEFEGGVQNFKRSFIGDVRMFI